MKIMENAVRFRKIHKNEDGVMDIPMKLIVVLMIIAISLPIVFTSLESYYRSETEIQVKNEIDKLIASVNQANEGAGGTSFRITVKFRQSSFPSRYLENVQIGDSLDGENCNIIWYKMEGRNQELIIINKQEIHVTGPNNEALILGPGNYDLIIEHFQLEERSFVIVRIVDDSINKEKFGVDFGDQMPDLKINSYDIGFIEKEIHESGLNKVDISINIRNVGSLASGSFEVLVQKGGSEIETIRVDSIQYSSSRTIICPSDGSGLSLTYGEVVKVTVDVNDEVDEYYSDNNMAQNIYEYRLRIMLGSNEYSSEGKRGTRADSGITFEWRGLDEAVYIVIKEFLENNQNQGYTLVNDISSANIVVLIGGPLAITDEWSQKLNQHTLNNHGWGFDGIKMVVNNINGVRPSSAVIGKGDMHNTDDDNFDGKKFIWVYGLHFEGTILAGRGFMKYISFWLNQLTVMDNQGAYFLESQYVDDQHDWLMESYQEVPDGVEKWKEDYPDDWDTLKQRVKNLMEKDLNFDDGDDTDLDGLLDTEEDKDGDLIVSNRESDDETNPLTWDTERDGMDDEWEQDYDELNPRSNDRNRDPDEDGIDNINEYLFREFGSNPIELDIFIEVDWMTGHQMTSEAQNYILEAFDEKDITIHIDTGNLGGGTEIPHDRSTTTDEFVGPAGNRFNVGSTNNLYGNFFTDNRKNIFHYCVFGHVDNDNNDGYTWLREEAFWISDVNMRPRDEDQAQTFMHELGHSFGLNADWYYSSPTSRTRIDDSDYPSVMRYGYGSSESDYSVIDYSDIIGTLTVWDHSNNPPTQVTHDTDDWGVVFDNIDAGI